MKALGIRWKFALWAAALVGFVLLVFAGGTFANLYHEQIEVVDLSLEAERRYILSLSDPGAAARTLEELLRFEPWLAAAIFADDGRIARRSKSLPEQLARATLAESKLHTARDERGGAWRLVSFRAGSSTFVLGHALTEVHEIVQDLLVSYGLSLPIVLVVAALGGWWVAGRALAPLRELTTAAESIRAEHLDRRVPSDGAMDEIRRLGDVLNAMLARLEQSFHQAHRFVADASHELRTPLTIIHGEIERLLRTPNLDPAHEEKLLSLQEEIGRLDRITEHLLLLARFDSGNVTMAREPVDFSALVRAACEDAELLATAQQIEVATEIAKDVTVSGDQAHLRRVVLSLLDNATRYNHLRGRVECALERRGNVVELRVRNTGPGVPEPKRAQLFQRFFRVDPARARGGHGLGLSLSREIARAHGGDVEFNAGAPPGWTEFIVSLPQNHQENQIQ